MTTLISVGYTAREVVGGHPPAAVLGELLEREDLDRLVTLCRGIDDDVVVVYPRWASEPTLQRLQTARSALQTLRLSWYAAAASPLAGTVLVSLASALADHLQEPGELLAGLPALERQLVRVTWLPRLSRLDDPPPTISQHLQSLLPWTAYAVTSWPEPAIHRISKRADAPPLPTPRCRVGLAVADLDGDLDWLWRTVTPILGQPRLSEVEPPMASARYWGCKRLTEAVAHPIDVPAMAEELLRGRLGLETCRWCGRATSASPCPFCGAVRPDSLPAPEVPDLQASGIPSHAEAAR